MKRTKLILTMVAMMSAVSVTGCSAKVTFENQETTGMPTVTIETNATENNATENNATENNVKEDVTTQNVATQNVTSQKQADNTNAQATVVTKEEPVQNMTTQLDPAIQDIFLNPSEDWNYALPGEEEFAYSFELHYDESTCQEYATIVCYGDKGAYWEYETDKYEVAQYERLELLESTAFCIYLNEGGTITALNIEDGRVLWQNSDYKGSGSVSTLDEEGNLYVAGYEAPALMILDPNGNTLCKVEQFADYYWPYEMDIEDNMLTILFDSADSAKVAMDIRDYSYTIN